MIYYLACKGILQITDFRQIFEEQEFPICSQQEFVRLLTKFEVAVELGNGELLIPSALHPDKPNLPQAMLPEGLVRNSIKSFYV